MIEFGVADGSATRAFTRAAAAFSFGPPDVPKLIGLLQNHGVTGVA